MASTWKCKDCGIEVERMVCLCKDAAKKAMCKVHCCLDTAANAKYAAGLSGLTCRRCGKTKANHFHAQTFCDRNPYWLRIGATTCCNCWFAAPSQAATFELHACLHCKARRKLMKGGAFKGPLHVNVVSINEFSDRLFTARTIACAHIPNL